MKSESNMTEQVNMVKKLRDEVVRLCREYPKARYQHPDRVDGNCSYFDGTVEYGPENSCGCVVGIAARNISYGSFITEAARRESSSEDSCVLNVLKAIGADIDSTDAKLIKRVQSSQDAGTLWGDALRYTYQSLNLSE